MKFLVVAFCGVLISTPALAQPATGGSGAALASDNETHETNNSTHAADGERLICRRVETSSASRMSTRRVCRTAQEWREAQRGG